MKAKIPIIELAILLALSASAGTAFAQQAISDEELLVDAGPDTLQQVIDSYQGEKAVIVNVWATWCAPCIEEFPHLVDIQRKYADQVQVIFVSADFPDVRGRALDFLRRQGVDWTTYFKQGGDQAFIESLSSDWSGALPFSKVYDTSGSVVASWQAKTSFETFEKYVKQAINP
ncbi:MAG: TlpA disulfide reductase family protein [Balneolaceae bacterium]|nr:TlpA disulfide reductase family protein [Balneolaceae bacterium]